MTTARKMTVPITVGARNPCIDAKKLAKFEGIPGKVEVRVRNGYLSTGYEAVNRSLPPNLRCLDGQIWVNGLTSVEFREIRGFTMTRAAQYYWGRTSSA